MSKGQITIDGINVSTISKDLLRSKIIALPQDPWFFLGTVRDNLLVRASNRNSISDSQLLAALEDVRLRSKFEAIARDLDFDGSILDIKFDAKAMLAGGEEQLFAFACAIFATGSILVMDEATSRYV
jgi:ATP-binding cassette subfamily C (CFTR/MRP) protein 1